MKRATRKGAGVLSFVRVDGLRRRERERESERPVRFCATPTGKTKAKNLPTRGIPGRFLSLVLIPPNRA